MTEYQVLLYVGNLISVWASDPVRLRFGEYARDKSDHMHSITTPSNHRTSSQRHVSRGTTMTSDKTLQHGDIPFFSTNHEALQRATSHMPGETGCIAKYVLEMARINLRHIARGQGIQTFFFNLNNQVKDENG